MAKNDNNNTNFENFEKYLKSVKERGYENLPSFPIIPDQNALMGKLATEGHALLAAEEKKSPSLKKDDVKRLETKLGETSTNPYIKARIKILNDMNEFARNRILNIEKRGDTIDNYVYDDFCKAVIKLGDKLSLDKH